MPIRIICVDKSLKNGPGYLVAGGKYGVGRSKRCAFILSDLSVSRFHAEITLDGETALVKDMGSRNGTYINGVRVEEAQLKPGQLVRFGNSQFQVVGEMGEGEPGSDFSGLSTHINPNKPTRQPPGMQELTKAQLFVLELLLTGIRERDIAAKLFLSPHTVHQHIREIYRKMKVRSRAALLALFVDPN